MNFLNALNGKAIIGAGAVVLLMWGSGDTLTVAAFGLITYLIINAVTNRKKKASQ